MRRAAPLVVLVATALAASGIPASGIAAGAAPERGGADPIGKHKSAPPLPPTPPSSPPATPATPPDAQPYDAQLIRLSEILGALSYLGALCGDRDAGEWRARMQALLEAEGTPAARKDRFAGAFNRGVQGYGLSYRTCTPNARLVIERFRAEGARIARDVENRYRAS